MTTAWRLACIYPACAARISAADLRKTGKMETLVSLVAGNPTEDCIAERRLWIAVLVMAVEDWRNGSLRKRREAQTFLFEDKADFERVCASAGVDPRGFRSRLQHIGKKVDMRSSWNRKLVA